MDTKYFQQALEEFRRLRPENSGMKIGDLTLKQLSDILLRAQERKTTAEFQRINKELGEL